MLAQGRLRRQRGRCRARCRPGCTKQPPGRPPGAAAAGTRHRRAPRLGHSSAPKRSSGSAASSGTPTPRPPCAASPLLSRHLPQCTGNYGERKYTLPKIFHKCTYAASLLLSPYSPRNCTGNYNLSVLSQKICRVCTAYLRGQPGRLVQHQQRLVAEEHAAAQLRRQRAHAVALRHLCRRRGARAGSAALGRVPHGGSPRPRRPPPGAHATFSRRAAAGAASACCWATCAQRAPVRLASPALDMGLRAEPSLAADSARLMPSMCPCGAQRPMHVQTGFALARHRPTRRARHYNQGALWAGSMRRTAGSASRVGCSALRARAARQAAAGHGARGQPRHAHPRRGWRARARPPRTPWE